MSDDFAVKILKENLKNTEENLHNERLYAEMWRADYFTLLQEVRLLNKSVFNKKRRMKKLRAYIKALEGELGEDKVKEVRDKHTYPHVQGK